MAKLRSLGIFAAGSTICALSGASVLLGAGYAGLLHLPKEPARAGSRHLSSGAPSEGCEEQLNQLAGRLSDEMDQTDHEQKEVYREWSEIRRKLPELSAAERTSAQSHLGKLTQKINDLNDRVPLQDELERWLDRYDTSCGHWGALASLSSVAQADRTLLTQNIAQLEKAFHDASDRGDEARMGVISAQLSSYRLQSRALDRLLSELAKDSESSADPQD